MLIKREQFAWHWCNLAAKESGLECACVNHYDFTVLVNVSWGCCWVSICTVWPLRSKWLSKESNKSASNFALSLSIPLQKLLRWFKRLPLWATGDWQLYHNTAPAHASHMEQVFLQNIKSPRWLSPHKAQMWHPKTLAFPKSKITFEREEISDPWWDSGKYNEATDGKWNNCVRSQGAFFEGDWAIIILCTMFPVSCTFFNKCLSFG